MKKLLFFVLILHLFYTLYHYSGTSHDHLSNYLYNITYALFFLFASVTSFIQAKKCSTHRSTHLALGFGMLSFVMAQVSWFLYNTVLTTQMPYPSVADIFFMGFYLFIVIAAITGLKHLKTNFSFSVLGEITLVTTIFTLIMYSFISQSGTDTSSLIVILINFAYPFFDALLVAFTLTGIRHNSQISNPSLLFFMAGFLMLAFGDTLFSYQSNMGYYWNGNIIDFIFAVSGFCFASATYHLHDLFHSQGNTSLKR